MKNNIRTLRLSLNMTLDDVATKAGTNKAQLSKLERGHIKLNDKWLTKLAGIYRCSVHDLIDDEQKKPPSSLPSIPLQAIKTIEVAVKGEIDVTKAGLIAPLEPHAYYEIKTGTAGLEKICDPRKPFDMERLSAFTIRGGMFQHYAPATECIFLSLLAGQEHWLTQGRVILCSVRDQNTGDYHDFIRTVHIDQQGFPYAIFSVRYGKHACATLASTLLLGDLPPSEMMELSLHADAGKKISVPVALSSKDITIKGMLIKTIHTELSA